MEARILQQIEGQVKIMVRNQLKAAGFDMEVTALLTSVNGSHIMQARFCLDGASLSTTSWSGSNDTTVQQRPKEDNLEEKFWEGRISLRL